MSNRNTSDEGGGNGAMIFLFIGLLIAKAAGMDIPWLIVTSPIWIPFLYIVFFHRD